MLKPDWQKAKDIFAEAMDHAEASRMRFLADRCGDDDRLYKEVSSLIEAALVPDNVIESNSIDLASLVGADNQDYKERQFGKYRILREIGSGGMGTVFLATRDDGEFSKQVALKIVRQSIPDREIVSRFKRERQILADLNHPNIAVLHDGGVNDRDEPFLAMEFIDGRSLITYCETNALSIRERLELFLKVCSAVSYAHKNLVVHRDIKPSNILVTSEGEPKLLDFGLAKAFASSSSVTQTTLRAFTPAYASPEQIRGENITTASDIYSLGVVFYEMLTGEKPLDLDNKSLDEILKTLCGPDPQKPSSVERTKARNAETSQILKGDLDIIALTALRKEPERRFSSVDVFADEIRRHLEGRPISARPNTARYIAGKFIRRNKIAVTAAALLIVTMLAGLGISLWQAETARRERDRAEKRFRDVRQLSNSLLFEIAPKLERLQGSVEARQALVEKALEYLDSLAAEAHTDVELNSELAAAYEKVGDLQGNIEKPNLSDFAGAVSSLQKARALRAALPPTDENLLSLANNLKLSGSIRNRQHDVAGALEDSSEARRIFKGLLAKIPGTEDLILASVDADLQEAQIYSFNNRYAEAIPEFRSVSSTLRGMDQLSPKVRRLSAVVYSALANALSWNGQQSEAEVEMSRAIAVADKLVSDLPNDPEVLSAVLQTYILASSVSDDTDTERSVLMARKAVEYADKAVAADKADGQAIYNRARANSRAGISLANAGQLASAVDHLRLAESILSGLIEREPRNVIYQRDLAIAYVRMGDASERRHDVADALLRYQNSAVIFEKIAANDPQNTVARRDLAQSLRSVGKSQIAMAQLPAAQASLRRAKALLDQLKAEDALGGYDQQLIDDVENTLRSI